MSTTPDVKSPPKNGATQIPLEIDATRSRLDQLGLAFAADCLGDELAEAVKHNRAAHDERPSLEGRNEVGVWLLRPAA